MQSVNYYNTTFINEWAVISRYNIARHKRRWEVIDTFTDTTIELIPIIRFKFVFTEVEVPYFPF
jgi:hypothetical protein